MIYARDKVFYANKQARRAKNFNWQTRRNGYRTGNSRPIDQSNEWNTLSYRYKTGVDGNGFAVYENRYLGAESYNKYKIRGIAKRHHGKRRGF